MLFAAIQCPLPTHTNTTYFSSQNNRLGSVIQMTCAYGHRIQTTNQTASTECQGNKTWSTDLDSCQRESSFAAPCFHLTALLSRTVWRSSIGSELSKKRLVLVALRVQPSLHLPAWVLVHETCATRNSDV